MEEFNYLKSAKPLWPDSLDLNTKSPGISGTYLMNVGKMKGESTMELASGIPASNH